MRRYISGCALVWSLFVVLGPGASFALAAPPTVTIEDAGSVSYLSAHAKGTVDPLGEEASCHFEFISQGQLDENLTNGLSEWEFAPQAPCDVEPILPGSGPVTVEAQLDGLTPSTVYHLRLVATNADGPSEAVAANTFETQAVGPAAVTIDPVGAVTASSAEVSGSVNPEAPPGNPSAFDVYWTFVCEPGCSSVGESIPADSNPHQIHETLTGLEPNTEYEVRLVASNAGGPADSAIESFTTAAVGPEAETIPAFALGNGTEALIGGRVNPKNSATTYWVEFGTDESYGLSAPATEDGDAGSGGQAQFVTQRVSGLAPGTVYHYRVVAHNTAGSDEGDDMTFVTAPATSPPPACPNDSLRTENSSTELPDCRAYEQVSPQAKNGYDAGTSITRGTTILQNVYSAAPDGSAFTLESFGAFSGASEAAPTLSPYLSRRGIDGWSTIPLAPKQGPSARGDFSNFNFYSPDLEHAVVRTAPGPSLAPGDTPGEPNLYLRDNRTGTYQTLNLGVSCKTVGCAIAGTSADLSHIIFEAEGKLFEWVNGQVSVASILTDESETPGGAGGGVGALGTPNQHLISEDGSRIVFTASENGEPGQIYVRLNGERTVLASASQRTTTDPSHGTPVFLGASSDLSKVFFTDNQALTDDAPIGSVSLYEYDVEDETVTDISVDRNPGEDGPTIVSNVLGNSEDGSSVYFSSSNQLLPDQPGLPGQSNVYLWHDGVLSLAVSGASGSPSSIRFTTNYVTPDGRYLMFEETNRLTSYDNTDAQSGLPDQESYLYDSVADRLTCVSCTPDGDGQGGGGGATFPVRPARQFLYQPVGVSDDGSRVFFDSLAALVPQDQNESVDPYMWEGGRVHLISTGTSGEGSFLAAASADGSNVFLVTRQQLVPGDRDQLLDVYDARENGGFPAAPEVVSCASEESCRAAGGGAPGAPGAASEFIAGAKQPSAAKRLRRALRACNHKPKRARAKCRAKAKKRFGRARSGLGGNR